MLPLTSIELMRIWDEGIDQSIPEKTLRLLSKACSVEDHNQLGRLSIGDRDARLLQLREWMFGNTLKNVANCPKCNEKIEWVTNVADLYLKPISPELSVKTYLLEEDDFSIRFRLPDTHDLSRVAADRSYWTDPKKLLSDCILEINIDGKEYATSALPDSAWEALNERMELEDPQADIRIKTQCPSCSHQWESPFDIVSFLWLEVHNWALRTLQEVYQLGRAFGWSENDILTMSARRRQLYLQMLGA